MIASPDILAVVCIPTFRRPDWLARTLASVLDQRTSFPFAVVVIDNDAANPVGAAVARKMLAATSHPGHVEEEAQQGNCHAINAAFGAAQRVYPSAHFVLMIDDDEEATPGWLQAMVDAAITSDADIVGGPVRRRMDGPVAAGIAEHPLFASIEQPSGPITMIHGTGNCLIRRTVFETLDNPAFDLHFNFLGGGDMDFFTRCQRAGKRFFWSADAVIHEYVATDRLSPRWLMQRSLRTGTINFAIDRRHAPGPAGMSWLVLKNIISLGLSLPRAAAMLVRYRHWLPASHPPMMSIGRVLGMLGIYARPYQASPPAPVAAEG